MAEPGQSALGGGPTKYTVFWLETACSAIRPRAEFTDFEDPVPDPFFLHCCRRWLSSLAKSGCQKINRTKTKYKEKNKLSRRKIECNKIFNLTWFEYAVI